MKEELEKTQIDFRPRTDTLAEMKKNSQICHELFPGEKHDPVTTGELLFLIRSGRLGSCDEDQIREAGLWWLWARGLFIQNTVTRPMKKRMGLTALEAVRLRQPIHFVTARSPELVHAQVPGHGDPNMPRSQAALRLFSGILEQSNRFLPTAGTVILADIAIDNIEEVLKFRPDLEDVILENLQKLESILAEERLFPEIKIKRMSRLVHPSGQNLGELINTDGSVNTVINFSPHAEKMIAIATRESIFSHQKMFGWSEERSKIHNRNLAKTMALAGQAVKAMTPLAMLVHNEAFISRGALNNLLNDPEDPLPVICLNTLLERKHVAKE